jgi:hypothetical protein
MAARPPTIPDTAPLEARNPHPARIAAIAAAILILELAFIRIVPSEVRAAAYFTNLILMASFFGLGLGCILARWRGMGALLSSFGSEPAAGPCGRDHLLPGRAAVRRARPGPGP